MRTYPREGHELERELDKRFEQEPRALYRGPRNETEYNERAKERLAGFGGGVVTHAVQRHVPDRLALKHALVSSEPSVNENVEQPGFKIASDKPWRPADGQEIE